MVKENETLLKIEISATAGLSEMEQRIQEGG